MKFVEGLHPGYLEVPSLRQKLGSLVTGLTTRVVEVGSRTLDRVLEDTDVFVSHDLSKIPKTAEDRPFASLNPDKT